MLKWLLFNNHLVTLLELIRRCPSRFINSKYSDILTNWLIKETCFDRLIFQFYIHIIVAITFGETGGHGAVDPKPSNPARNPDINYPYHHELVSLLNWQTPQSSDGGYDAAFNILLRPFLQSRKEDRSSKDWRGLRMWDLDLTRCEELCGQLWRVMVHMNVIVKEIQAQQGQPVVGID